MNDRLTKTSDWAVLSLSVVLIFVLFHEVATRLGSDRGQAGMLVCAIVVGLTLAAECVLFKVSLSRAVTRLGLRWPAPKGLTAACLVSVLLLLLIPAYAAAARTEFSVRAGWILLVPGLFAQAGIAEEALFRGYLFSHVREGRSFRSAVLLATGPFVLAHLLMFAALPWEVALASVLLAAIVSWPLAHLFELGGQTIWAPAIVHTVIQGAVKVVVPAESSPGFPLVWIAACAIIPFVVFPWSRQAGKR